MMGVMFNSEKGREVIVRQNRHHWRHSGAAETLTTGLMGCAALPCFLRFSPQRLPVRAELFQFLFIQTTNPAGFPGNHAAIITPAAKGMGNLFPGHIFYFYHCPSLPLNGFT
ncbi:MAG: hypothetical protein IMW93_11725 [Thermoanaerobacteraceae bacterium]|nr:hypothetical protein [Thermoanaerobacteraceae bacterium]